MRSYAVGVLASAARVRLTLLLTILERSSDGAGCGGPLRLFTGVFPDYSIFNTDLPAPLLGWFPIARRAQARSERAVILSLGSMWLVQPARAVSGLSATYWCSIHSSTSSDR